jgi:hypothetical protein
LRIPFTANKRLDVELRDLKSIPRVKAPILALEGQSGWVLLAQPVTVGIQKLQVYGVRSRRLDIELACIRPCRTGRMGGSLSSITVRVVIIGRTVGGEIFRRGDYALTQPQVEHPYGSEAVAVRFEMDKVPFFYPVSSLCYAENVSVQSLDGQFPETYFN